MCSSYRGKYNGEVSKTSTHVMFSLCLSQHFSFSSSKLFQAVLSFAPAVQLHPFNKRWCLGTWGTLTDTNWMKEEWLLQTVNGGLMWTLLPKLSVMCREIPWNTQHPIGRWSKNIVSTSEVCLLPELQKVKMRIEPDVVENDSRILPPATLLQWWVRGVNFWICFPQRCLPTSFGRNFTDLKVPRFVN